MCLNQKNYVLERKKNTSVQQHAGAVSRLLQIQSYSPNQHKPQEEIKHKIY